MLLAIGTKTLVSFLLSFSIAFVLLVTSGFGLAVGEFKTDGG